jgi:hypothetical protein
MAVNLSLADWDCPEFMDLPPDPDLLTEWATHDRERTAGRHPEQPAYSTPYADKAVAERMNDGE